jgi:uncharacterized protein (TIGR02453 family)
VTFTGFPDDAFAFYEGLEADNSKTYWTRHKSTYDTCVRGPMVELLDLLEPEFGTGHTFRPYRDVRFSRDKSPYKTHQGGFTETADGIGFYVQVDASGMLAAAGFHAHTPDQVERYRAAVDEDHTGEQLRGIVAKLTGDGFDIGGETLKTKPRGYPADHPRIELLRHKSLTAAADWPVTPWMHEPAAADRVRETWRALVPLVEWIGTHVGAR